MFCFSLIYVLMKQKVGRDMGAVKAFVQADINLVEKQTNKQNQVNSNLLENLACIFDFFFFSDLGQFESKCIF